MNSPISAAKKLFFILASLALTIPATGQQWQPWAMKPDTASAVEYVASTCGNVTGSSNTTEGGLPCSDSNDGKSWGTAKATIAAAIAALPTKTIAAGNAQTYTIPVGTVFLATNPAGYSLSSTVQLSQTGLRIVGSGVLNTVINCTASTCFKFINSAGILSISNWPGGLFDLSLVGNGSASQIGVLSQDVQALQLINVKISGFSGTSSIGLELLATLSGSIMERNNFQNVAFENCTNELVLDGSSLGGSNFGHQTWINLQFLIYNGQTAITIRNGAQLYSSFITGVINTYGGATASNTGVSISGAGSVVKGMFGIYPDNGGGTNLTQISGNTTANFLAWGWSPPGINQFASTDAGVAIVTQSLAASDYGGGLCFHLNGTYEWCAYLDTNGYLGIYNPVANQEQFSFRPQAIAIKSTGGGSVSIVAPSTAGDYNVTLPGIGTLAITSQLPLSGSVTGSVTPLAANSCGDTVSTTVTNATTSMVAVSQPQSPLIAGLSWVTSVSGANTVAVTYCNVTTASITPAANTFNIRVIQ